MIEKRQLIVAVCDICDIEFPQQVERVPEGWIQEVVKTAKGNLVTLLACDSRCVASEFQSGAAHQGRRSCQQILRQITTVLM